MTVAAVQGMDMAEWMGWGVYFGRKAQQRELARRKGA